MQTSNISKIYIQDDEPSNPIPNRIWLDTTSQTLKRYNFSTKTWSSISTIDVITNLTSTSITVDIVENTAYKYGTLTTLKINSVEDSVVESMIFFTSGNTATSLSYPSSLNVIGTISVEANTSYAISIVNNIMVMGALST